MTPAMLTCTYVVDDPSKTISINKNHVEDVFNNIPTC